MDWLVRLIDNVFHVHEWGPWEAKVVVMERRHDGKKMFSFRQHYQQRKCKTCHKIEQEQLGLPGGSND